MLGRLQKREETLLCRNEAILNWLESLLRWQGYLERPEPFHIRLQGSHRYAPSAPR